MRVVCPSCQATYEVPVGMLTGTARLLRCARCSTEWQPEAHPEPPAPQDPPPPPPEPPAEPAMPEPAAAEAAPAATTPAATALAATALAGTEPRARPVRGERKLTGYRPRGSAGDEDEHLPPRDDEASPSRRGAMIGWMLTVLLLAALGWSAVSYRASVMAAWPPSERVYAALGLR